MLRRQVDVALGCRTAEVPVLLERRMKRALLAFLVGRSSGWWPRKEEPRLYQSERLISPSCGVGAQFVATIFVPFSPGIEKDPGLLGEVSDETAAVALVSGSH